MAVKIGTQAPFHIINILSLNSNHIQLTAAPTQ